MEKDRLMLSVLIITYNHAAYIGQAIDSVLNQRTQYTYELVIHDDFSTDGTREILIEYQKKYPDKIRLVLEEENVWTKGVSNIRINCLKYLKGKYMCILEGDDYWICEKKIEKQVTFLERNDEYAGVAHASLHLIEGGKEWVSPTNKSEGEYSIYELIDWKDAFHTASFMFRTRYYMEMPTIITNIPNGDWANAVWMASKGAIYYSEEIMTAHRCFTKGSFSKTNFLDNPNYEKIFEVREKNCNLLDSVLHYKYHDCFIHSMDRRWFGYYYEQCRFRDALQYWKVIFHEQYSITVLIRCVLLGYFPSFIAALKKLRGVIKNCK